MDRVPISSPLPQPIRRESNGKKTSKTHGVVNVPVPAAHKVSRVTVDEPDVFFLYLSYNNAYQ